MSSPLSPSTPRLPSFDLRKIESGSPPRTQTTSRSFLASTLTNSCDFSRLSQTYQVQQAETTLTPAEVEKARLSPLDLAEVCTNGTYKRAPHLELVNDALLDVAAGKIKRLMVFMPPQHGKSTLISHYGNAWWIGTFPDRPLILASYGQEWAEHWGSEVRSTMQEFGQELWGLSVRSDTKAKGRWRLDGHKGGMTSVGIGGAMTGRGSGLNVYDDPVKDQEEARSAIIQQRNVDWHDTVAKTRLAADAPEILVQTRWHEGDLAGRILEAEGHGWTVISLPALAEENDLLGREPGEALWPEMFPREYIEEVRYGVVDPETGQRRGGTNAYWFAAMYQQRPSPEEGGLFPRAWWQRYGVMPSLADQGGIFIDTATDDKKTGDYFAMATWRTAGHDFYVENVVNQRLSFPDQVRAVLDARNATKRSESDPGLPVYIEEVPWALPLITTLNDLIGRVIGVKPGGHSKIARAMAATPFVEARNVYLPESANWVGDFIEQHAAFPNATHDDMVDTTSLALNVLGANAPYPMRPQAQALNARPEAQQQNGVEGLLARRRMATPQVKHLGGGR